MKRSMSILGLALLMGFATSATLSTTAYAAVGQFTANAYPAVIKGEQEAGKENYLETTPELKTECATATYQATSTAASTQLTVTPHYAGCVTSVNTDIVLNGCHYLFKTVGTTVNGATPGTADVICPGPTKSITFEMTIFGSVICQVHIPAQQGLTGITFTNKGSNTVTIDVDVTDQIDYSDTDLSPFCPFNGDDSFSNGDFVSSITLAGFKDGPPSAHPTTSGVTTYGVSGTTGIDVG